MKAKVKRRDGMVLTIDVPDRPWPKIVYPILDHRGLGEIVLTLEWRDGEAWYV